MRNRFDRQLKKLNDELIDMGSMIEKSIEKALVALVTQNVKKAQEVIAYDLEIDRQEREIESLCMKLLLQQQPVARDLRLISSALKMITDMERIGDQAADIAELAIFMAEKPYIKELKHITQMGQETMVMVVTSVDAFVEKDLEKARFYSKSFFIYACQRYSIRVVPMNSIRVVPTKHVEKKQLFEYNRYSISFGFI